MVIDGIIDHFPDGGSNEGAGEWKTLRSSEARGIDATSDSRSKARSDGPGSNGPNTLRAYPRNDTTPEAALSPAYSSISGHRRTLPSPCITCRAPAAPNSSGSSFITLSGPGSSARCSGTLSSSISSSSFAPFKADSATDRFRGRLQFRQCGYL